MTRRWVYLRTSLSPHVCLLVGQMLLLPPILTVQRIWCPCKTWHIGIPIFNCLHIWWLCLIATFDSNPPLMLTTPAYWDDILTSASNKSNWLKDFSEELSGNRIPDESCNSGDLDSDVEEAVTLISDVDALQFIEFDLALQPRCMGPAPQEGWQRQGG